MLYAFPATTDADIAVAGNFTPSGRKPSNFAAKAASLRVLSLPVPSLWLDVLQKIKALGYNGVSFYTDWALLEGQEGTFSAEGVFSLDPFFDAASEAGIYLLAVWKNKGYETKILNDL